VNGENKTAICVAALVAVVAMFAFHNVQSHETARVCLKAAFTPKHCARWGWP
jgi:predicted negative regulator of RcsB-dependent stress response